MIIEPRTVQLTTRTEVDVLRSVPHADLRRIGAWVFCDHFGPTPQVEGMVVAAHPHTGLQTVTWLFDGSVDHRDSIGSAQHIAPGQLNLMTAGRGIAHSEKSLPGPSTLHAVQLWLALPENVRDQEPSFEHVPAVPRWTTPGAEALVFIGELDGIRSPATVFSPLVGAEIRVDGSATIPLRPEWEYGVLVVSGSVTVAGSPVPRNALHFRPTGFDHLTLSGDDARVILLGGEPFTEPIVMWWNFIARSDAEIRTMRSDWNAEKYPVFLDDIGGRIPAPNLPSVTLIAR